MVGEKRSLPWFASSFWLKKGGQQIAENQLYNGTCAEPFPIFTRPRAQVFS